MTDASQDQDDTSSLSRGGINAPSGPRADRLPYKRARRESHRGDYWDHDTEGRESSEGPLRYDEGMKVEGDRQ